jgi:hypothetical protein
MIKAGQTGRIRKRILYQDEEKQTQRERRRRRGPDTQFYQLRVGLHGIIQLLHLASSKGDRASARGRHYFVFGAARRAFHLLFTSCTKRISLPLHILARQRLLESLIF